MSKNYKDYPALSFESALFYGGGALALFVSTIIDKTTAIECGWIAIFLAIVSIVVQSYRDVKNKEE